MLTNEQILAAIDAAESAAFGPKSSEIATDRADALDRYMGKPYGDEQAGRSQVVSRDISDVVEGVTANVLKPFVGGDKVVMFNPRGPEDEPAAQQETDYVNFVVMERNNGFVVLNSAIKDALLLRNGYLKCGWAKRDDVNIERYQGLSDEELALLLQDEEIEIVGHQDYPDPFGQGAQMMAPQQAPQQMPMLHDVTVHRKYPTEYVEVMPAPPDEILVSSRSTEPSVQHADFVQHACHKTLSELRELGYDVDDDISDSEDSSESIEDYARNLFSSESDQWSDPTANMARRLVKYKETWMRLDVDGDGIAELRRICTVGKNILRYKKGADYKGGEEANEEADLIPIACFTPVLMPHRHLGVSIYDLVKDIAQIKTAMLRSHLDNRYLQNNAEKVVNVDAIENIDDFLISRPGGLKRVRGSAAEAVMPLVVPDTGAGALQTLEYLDSIRENRTGYTKTAEGMKSSSLATETLGELQMQQSQSGIRLEMVARTIAETGLRDLFRIVHALTLKHSSRAEKIRLRNDWVDVNPREWVRRTDLSISVGLGSTTGPQQMQNLMMIGQAQQNAMPLGIVTPENVFNTLSKLATAAGFKNPVEFFTQPQKTPKKGPDGQPVIGPDGQPEMESAMPPPPEDPMVQTEKIKQQGLQQLEPMKLQAQAQIEDKKTQNNLMQAQFEAQTNAQLEEYKINKQAELERFKAEQDAALEKYKIDRQVEAEIQKAQIQAHAQIRSTQKAQTGEDPEDPETIQSKQAEADKVARRDQVHEQTAQALIAVAQHLARPKKIIRGPDGRAQGVQ